MCARLLSLGWLLVTLLACQSQSATPEAAPVASTSTPIEESANTIRLTNGEWPPYLSETLPHKGLASRIVTEAFATQGFTVEYGFFPWPRALSLAQEGAWDGSAVWFKNAEREKDFYFSEPVMDSQYVFFHLKSYPFEWEEMEDLAEVRIGATLEYDYGEAFTQAEEAGIISVERIPADEQNFSKLLGGRIDVFPLDLEVGLSMLRKNFTPEEMEQITYHPLPIRSDPGYLLLSRKVEGNAELIDVFNAGLEELRANGQLQQFVEESRQGK
ncbi:MAG: transporter substrate-binding domain-containing protein [Ardenticatenales bacterium]|nr:transporter substrate-binding domain-containing protein [Ardenticatenales bacterium]